MPSFTGQLGRGQLSLTELGGPALTTIAAPPVLTRTALPYIAHLYANDWTFKATLGPLANHPVLKQTINAGFNALTLEVTDRSLLGTLYGTSTYGTFTYGGIAPGDLMTLTEQGGDGSVVYGGLVEDCPDLIAPNGTSHQIALTPFVAELGDARWNHTYTGATDLAQMVRDAVRQTNHCIFTPDSIPNTGILYPNSAASSPLVFNNSTVLDVLNTARRLTGPNYCWFVDQVGMVWFQAVSTSAALFTVKKGVDYNSRKSSYSISGIKNKISILGGVPKGGSAPAVAEYNNLTSQTQYGLRAWDPPPTYPAVTDVATLQVIANTLGAAFDRPSKRLEVTLPAFGQRLMLGWPGGATLRTWEPDHDSLQQSEVGSGNYSANFIVLDVETDGAQQKVVGGDMPISNINEFQGEIDRLIQRTTLNNLIYTAASLNTPTVMGPGGSFSTAAAGARLQWDAQGLHMYNAAGAQTIFDDASAATRTIYDAAGIPRVEQGVLAANGVSPAQVGMRVNDAARAPIWDSLGLIGVMTRLGKVDQPAGLLTFTTTTPTVVTGVTLTFTLARPQRILAFALAQANSAGQTGLVDVFLDGVDQGSPLTSSAFATMAWGIAGPTVSSGTIFEGLLAAGSHTLDLRGYLSAPAGTLTVAASSLLVYQLGA